jgi:hypothetical protein
MDRRWSPIIPRIDPMLTVTLNAEGKAVSASTESSREPNTESRWDWRSLERAEQVAAELTEATGTLYIATDAGPYVSPRFDVIEAPKVGDAISYAFNGDYYPCGEIERISDSLRVIRSTTGRTFYRRRASGAWVSDGTWSMVPGHISRMNPEF